MFFPREQLHSLTISHKINVVAFVTDRSKEYGTPVKEPAVERVSNDDLMDDFAGWGSETRSLLCCIETPDRWNINVVYPFVETYVRDTVALIGDSVSDQRVRI